MPIKPEMRGYYPIDWPRISQRVRFERAAGICQGCGRPHGMTVRCLPDGRWFDAARPPCVAERRYWDALFCRGARPAT
jgi:hypothetical protein